VSWLESHTTLREHPKRKRLSRILGMSMYETIGLLHVWWWWVLDFAPEGDLSGFSDEDIADAVDFADDAHALVAALTRAGFLDADRRVHDWDEFAEKWIARRAANRERMRLARAARNGPRSSAFTHVSGTSGARAPQKSKSVGLPDQPTGPTYQPTGPDQPTPPPLPPSPQAGKGGGAKTRGRRGVRGEDRLDTQPGDAAAALPEVMPLTEEDRGVWDRALESLRPLLTPGNHEEISRVEPVGRAPDGGLRLRSPPGNDRAHRLRTYLVRALLDVGDGAAANLEIIGR
jgi:hypothetical protein